MAGDPLASRTKAEGAQAALRPATATATAAGAWAVVLSPGLLALPVAFLSALGGEDWAAVLARMVLLLCGLLTVLAAGIEETRRRGTAAGPLYVAASCALVFLPLEAALIGGGMLLLVAAARAMLLPPEEAPATAWPTMLGILSVSLVFAGTATLLSHAAAVASG
jgi:hypothetical protein